MADPADFAVLGRLAAEDLDDKTPPGVRTAAGLLRHMARTIDELLAQLDHRQAVPAGAGACPCGAAITQPPTGRRRRWCTTCRPPRIPAKREGDRHADHT